MTNEFWERTSYAPGIEVSSLGRVRSFHTHEPKTISTTPSGGRKVNVPRKNGRGDTRVFVDELVLSTFTLFDPKQHEVIHLNGDLGNCHLSNLDYRPKAEGRGRSTRPKPSKK